MSSLLEMKNQMQLRSTRHLRKHERGASILEIVIVVTISTILGAVAIPQLVTARRVLRSSLIPRQVLSQLRLVRQEAMSTTGDDISV
jgi:Tfp pilus assembly protein FimT